MHLDWKRGINLARVSKEDSSKELTHQLLGSLAKKGTNPLYEYISSRQNWRSLRFWRRMEMTRSSIETFGNTSVPLTVCCDFNQESSWWSSVIELENLSSWIHELGVTVSTDQLNFQVPHAMSNLAKDAKRSLLNGWLQQLYSLLQQTRPGWSLTSCRSMWKEFGIVDFGDECFGQSARVWDGVVFFVLPTMIYYG